MTVISARALGMAALFAWATAVAQPRFDFDATPGLLTKAVVPLRHAMTLTLDPDADGFSGEATLTLRVRQPVQALVLHAHQLEASSARLAGSGPERRLEVRPGDAPQTWRLVPADGAPIAPGEHRLLIAWTGRVQHSDSALFRVPHKAFGGPATMLATQLEAVFARMLFPGFDEPAFRTVFEISVRAPQGRQVLSNMPLLGEPVPEGSGALHRFAPTPPMPSYLVAVAVGRFDSLSGSAAGVPLRILTAPGRQEQARYAMATTQKLLPYYTEYFGQAFALPKLDQLAVPGVRRGAMEDWGLISYDEGLLLHDPARSGPQARSRVFSIIAHEVAHQWFGNLVTAASWEEIWLNEAFATWMAEKAMAHFNPEWQVPLRRRETMDWAMARDAGPSTRAIRSGPVREDKVFDVFDNITYEKGGAVLSMLEDWIGAEPFRRGLADYMAARRLSNATAGDLWHHIGRASGRDVAAVASSWTDQPGFPLIVVGSACEQGQTRLTLVQRRFRSDGVAADASRWQLPLVMLHGGQTHTLLLGEARQALSLPGCPALPTVLNPGGRGFYRVAYPAQQQHALGRALATLPATAQATLLSDTFALAQAGELTLADWLALLPGVPELRGAGRAAIFDQVRRQSELLRTTFQGTPAAAPLDELARALFAPALAALGWDPAPGEADEDARLRDALIGALARHGDADVIRRARILFDDDEAGRAALPAGIRTGVFEAVALGGDAARFAQLVARLKAAPAEEERWRLAAVLALTPDPLLARRVLDLSLDGEVPSQIGTQLPGMLAGAQPVHGERAYPFVLENWARLAERAGPMFAAREWLLPAAAGGFSTPAAAAMLRADQQRLAGAPGESPAARVAAGIELRAAIRARELERLPESLRSAVRSLGTARAASPA